MMTTYKLLVNLFHDQKLLALAERTSLSSLSYYYIVIHHADVVDTNSIPNTQRSKKQQTSS